MEAIKTNQCRIVMLLFILTLQVSAQQKTGKALLLVPKGASTDAAKSSAGKEYSHNGFYIYRNCVYNFLLSDGSHTTGRLVDLKEDTLYFSNALDTAVARKYHQPLDTLAIASQRLRELWLIADRALGIYEKIHLNRFEAHYLDDSLHLTLPSAWIPFYNNDTTRYELVPYLTAQGINYLYSENGMVTLFYGPPGVKEAEAKVDPEYHHRRGVWYTPGRVDQIDGLALGVYSENQKNDGTGERDSLKVNGMNLELNFYLIFFFYGSAFNGPYPDSLAYYEKEIKPYYELKVNGLNLSLAGTINEATLNGMNIGGLSTLVDRINGLSVSGLSTFCYELNGVSVSAVRNRCTLGRGLQIGLYNKATDLKGLQIGLWNVNAKRKLPLINWQTRFKNS